MIIIPSIDLREGRVVRLQQGDYSRQLNYDVDPIQTAKQFAAAGAAWMHIVDLDGAKRGTPMQTALIGQIIQNSGVSVQAGGGIRSAEDVYQLLAAGASRVVVGTRALEDWGWFNQLVHRPDLIGKIVLALDAKDGIVATRAWTASSGKSAVEIAKQVSDWPLAAILYTDVARDGMMSGPNYEQTRKLAEAGKVAVIASGGVGNIQHIQNLKALPIWGVIVGRSLYEGAVDLREAIKVANQ
jgi:phosphoribosylformimino-5-aminoimidazole carboxamide ribotide isomerase